MASRETFPGRSVSLLGYFGTELRWHRENASMTQEQLGDATGYGGGLISKIEHGERTPQESFAERLDQVFSTDGKFLRLWRAVDEETAVTQPFRRYLGLEQRATTIETFECYLVPGLLETENYARHVIESQRPALPRAEVDSLLAARMTRQDLLTREDAPQLWAVIDESVLHRQVGTREEMVEQLQRLAEYREVPNVMVQVLPFDAALSPSFGVSFLVAELDDGSWVYHVDSWPDAPRADNGTMAHAYRVRYEYLKTEALSESASAGMIERVAKELA